MSSVNQNKKRWKKNLVMYLVIGFMYSQPRVSLEYKGNTTIFVELYDAKNLSLVLIIPSILEYKLGSFCLNSSGVS